MNRLAAAGLAMFAVALGWLSYGVQRSDFPSLIIAFAFLSIIMAALYFFYYDDDVVVVEVENGDGIRTGFRANHLIITAVVLRMIPLFSMPALSDDFYRFIWDGMLVIQGISPYVFTPAELMQSGTALPEISHVLYSSMNSPGYYSVYPAVCQAIFSVAWLIGGESILLNVIVIRLFIIAAEAGTLILMKILMERLELPAGNLVWYAFNPVVIVEFSGNLHFEALMVFFLLLTWYLLLRGCFRASAGPFVLAVHTKLLPVMILPWFLLRFGFKRGLIWISVVMAAVTMLFVPYLNLSDLPKIAESLALYFRTFEFNAGLYYLLRETGYLVKGYNIIATLGPALATAGTLLILLAAYQFRNTSIQGMAMVLMVTFAVHLFFSTTVHPWYVLPVTCFAVFTGYRFPVVWSVLLPLTYHAYRTEPVREWVWLVLLIYFIVLIVLLNDIRRTSKNHVYSGLKP
jgi:alpha-1,6-mannosyltransferase